MFAQSLVCVYLKTGERKWRGHAPTGQLSVTMCVCASSVDGSFDTRPPLAICTTAGGRVWSRDHGHYH